MPRGRFITLEGTEGVGKSTNLATVVRAVEDGGYPVVSTREPGGTPLAEEIRGLLLGVREEAVDATAELLLMFAARAQHVATVIEPALARGDWVVCDRFTDATYAYQGGGRGEDVQAIAALEALAHPGLQPDLTIYLDIDPRQAALRIEGREHDRIEREALDFFDRVRRTYLERAAQYARFRTIDAGRSLDAVTADVQRVVEELLARSP